MKVDSLWFEVKSKDRGTKMKVSLRTCRNCGEVKVTSNPCGFDHLAAILEYKAATQKASKL